VRPVAGLSSAAAILILGTGVGLAVGSANAETAAATELEAPDTADSGTRERSELRQQRRQEWWAHARAVLFSDIELSAEQSRGVDAIIETQLDAHRRSAELRSELEAAQQQADTKRIAAVRTESRAVRAQLKGPHECIEDLRALLSEEQRPSFDMNRARLAAEGQQPPKRRRQRRSRTGAEVTAE
jgi:hypothetical protein